VDVRLNFRRATKTSLVRQYCCVPYCFSSMEESACYQRKNFVDIAANFRAVIRIAIFLLISRILCGFFQYTYLLGGEHHADIRCIQ